MATSIDDLKAVFSSKNGFAKPNRYRVVLPNTTESRELNIMCDSATFPGKQIFTTEENITMKTEYAAYAYGTEDVEISFILSNDWTPWNYLYDWYNKIVSVNAPRIQRVNYKSNYTYQMDLEHLDSENRLMKRVTLLNAFPTSLNSIELGNGNENEVIRVSASFTYDNWIVRDDLNLRR